MTDRPRRQLSIRGLLLAILVIGLGLAVAVRSFRAEQEARRLEAMAREALARQAELAAVQAASRNAQAGPGPSIGRTSGADRPGPEVADLQRRILELEAEVSALRRQRDERPKPP